MDGERAYAITFEQTDPLFTIDLSDPASPMQRGALEIPGFVYHMEPRGDRLIGLGFDQGNPDGAITVSLFDVSDEVNIENTEQRHDESTPAVTLRMHGIAPTSRGGTVTSASGAISATFPAAGGFVLDAKSPVAGIVQEGALPATCTKQESSPGAKVITCGRGPSYQLIAGARPDYIGKPEPSNVVLSFR